MGSCGSGSKSGAKGKKSVSKRDADEPGKLLRISLQFFAEKDLSLQSPSNLRKGIRQLEKKIQEHENNLADPKIKWKDWDSFSEERKAGELRHWQKEIENFKESINNRYDELKKRGEK